MKKLQKLPLLIVIWVFSWAEGVISAENLPLMEDNNSTLLILRNGQILEGRITKIKDRYLVDLPDGEIHIRAADVDFLCRNLEEGYEHKRAVIQAGNWRDHLELARWCHKNTLENQAVAELAAAEVASPHNPLIAVLRRQMEPDAASPAKPKNKSPSNEGTSNEELDRMVRNLPPRTMESFTRTVQPMLMNHCIAAGCHGPQSTTNLRLLRVSAGETASRRLTQRNLATVLQYVDRENPDQSPLLTMPTAPHGTAKNAIFTQRQASQFSRMSDWVIGLGADDPSAPAQALVRREPVQNSSSDASADLSTMPRLLPLDARAKPLAASKKTPDQTTPDAAANSNEVTPTSYQEPPADFLQSNPSRTPKSNVPATIPQRLPNQKVKHGAPLPQEASKDPFDPELFNRRYHKAITPSDGGSQPPQPKPAENAPASGER
jgi:hypothetical protein